ncbi:electron transport complex subunit RsxG [Colwellia sp. MSW7]|uniref:Ion-translocating oxidoreductase complex subunit G n=1 Tax=Colwellia maritima TaxID=2912588 RepID=A0ABS9X4Y8_9GAMM|nr:electron transport complex subunit RsxG [Colwellia maritima]MCI2285308.1 electron transport complex subunit RsxG [Colwellia maritima]
MSAPLSDDKPKDETKTTSLFRIAIQKNSVILALFAIVCTAIVGLVNELTKDKIVAQAQLELLNTLHSIIEPNRYNNDITQDCINITAPSLKLTRDDKTTGTAYIARNNNIPIAVAITSSAPDGYNGNIDFIVAINMDNTVSGVRVLKHQETPGLGDKVEIRKSTWITRFNGKKLLSENDNRWAVAKDGGMFDQFTGATITPRAIVKAMKKTLLFFQNNKETLLTLPNSCAITNNDPQIEHDPTKVNVTKSEVTNEH